MQELLSASHQVIIFDACCLITLSCTGRIEDVLNCLPKPIMVADYVYDQEVLKSDLSRLVTAGLIAVATADSESEQNMVVRFALELDDGESITGAVAAHRNWAIATDDKKALTVFQRIIPHIQVISTLSMIKHWAEQVGASDAEVKLMLEKLRTNAPYEPKPSHPLYGWWREHIQR